MATLANIGANVGALARNIIAPITTPPGYGYTNPFNTGGGYANDFVRAILGLPSEDDQGPSLSDADDNSIVDRCATYIGHQFILAEEEIQQQDSASLWPKIDNHAYLDLMENPNPAYDAVSLWAATAASLARGNAYWLGIRDNAGRIAELWWAPQLQTMTSQYGCTPFNSMGQNGSLPDRYLYRSGGVDYWFPYTDVIHFRQPRMDPLYPFIGRDPLHAQRWHIGTDEQAGRYSYFILKNFGVVGALLVNKSDKAISDKSREEMKKIWQSRTTGSERGRLTFVPHEMDVSFPDNNPDKMALDKLGDTPEERIPAAFGLNATAVNLGAGLEHSTFNNVQEARRAAWDEGIAPLHKIAASAVTRKLLPLLGPSRAKVRLFFNYSNVPSQQEDKNDLRAAVAGMWKDGMYNLGQCAQALGEDLPKGVDANSRVFDLQQGMAAAAAATLANGGTAQPELNATPEAALNGVQITAGLEVVDRYRLGTISDVVAIGLLNALGIPRDQAEEMIKSTKVDPGAEPAAPETPIAPPSVDKPEAALPPKSEARAVEVRAAKDRSKLIQGAKDMLDEMGGEKGRESAVRVAQDRMGKVSSDLTNGKATQTQWAGSMREEITRAHVGQAALGYDTAELPDHIWDYVEDKIKFHQDAFDGFQADVKAGRYDNVLPDGEDGPAYTAGVNARAAQYANASRATYENVHMLLGKDQGHTMAIRIMGAVDHCGDCEAEAAKGWQPIGEIAEIGDSTCRANCSCVIETKGEDDKGFDE